MVSEYVSESTAPPQTQSNQETYPRDSGYDLPSPNTLETFPDGFCISSQESTVSSIESYSGRSTIDTPYSCQVSSTTSVYSGSDDNTPLAAQDASEYPFQRKVERTEEWTRQQASELNRPAFAAVSAAQRQHPRRTAPSGVASSCAQPSLPCSLTRQDARADCFVALLVGELGASCFPH